MAYRYLKARPNCYDNKNKRSRKDVVAIVIHYTGGTGDEAYKNCNYFAKWHEGYSGAHLFIDSKECCKSVPLNRSAWSVGGVYSLKGGAGQFYGKLTNYNTVSIELCDISTHDITAAQKKLLVKAVKYCKKYCPNIKDIVRHYDVNGKQCPMRYCGSPANDAKWNALKQELMQYI